MSKSKIICIVLSAVLLISVAVGVPTAVVRKRAQSTAEKPSETPTATQPKTETTAAVTTTEEATETETQPQTVPQTTAAPTTNPPATTQVSFTVSDMSGIMYPTIVLNVRKGPSTGYAVLGSVAQNAEVKVTGKCSNGWYRIDFKGAEGYCSGKYLSETKVVATTAAPTTRKQGSTGSSLPSGLFNNKLSDEQNAQALEVARQIANSIPSSLSTIERVEAATKKVYGYYSQCRYTMEGPYYAQAYGVFIAKEASCAGAARAAGLVFSLMGIKWEHAHAGEFQHQWCRVWIDGELYWADASIGECGQGAYFDT